MIYALSDLGENQMPLEIIKKITALYASKKLMTLNQSN